jgi:Skp family chaperone for outer membrane proteins
MVMGIEDTLGKLLSEFNHKAAELKAIDSQLYASRQRLDDAIKTEAVAHQKLREVTAELDQVLEDLTRARRDADKIKSTALGERDRVLAEAHREATELVESAELAVTAAANVIGKRKRPAA